MFFELSMIIIMSILNGLIVGIANRKNLEEAVVLFLSAFACTYWLGLILGNFISIALLFTIIYYYFNKKHYAEDNYSFAWKEALLFTIIIIVFIINFIFLPATIEIVEVRNKTLETLSVSNSLEGSFFLGTVSLHDKEYYTYNYLKDTELVQEIVLRGRDVHVFMDDSFKKPVVRYYEVYRTKEMSGFTIFYAPWFKELMERTEIDFYIPPDGLVQGINI